jgi:BioD-like phosphotransacetylase family protein
MYSVPYLYLTLYLFFLFFFLYLCQCVIEKEGARLAGVLVNKTAPKKVDQVREYLEKALGKTGVPIIGVVPDREFFESPCARDFEQLFKTKLMAGTDFRNRHFKEVRLATCSTRHFLSTYRKSSPATLWVIHASRTDLILALKSAAQEAEYQNRHDPTYIYQGGLLLTGSPNISFPRGLQEDIFDMVIQTVNFPTLYVSQSSHQVMNTIERHTAKLNVDDEVRSRAVMEHYAEHIDVELLLERVDGNQAAMRDFGCPR